jgi:hypothetical protein
LTDPEFDPERLLTALSGDVAVLRTRVTGLAGAVEQLRTAVDRTDLDKRLDALAEQIRQIAELQEETAGGNKTGPVWNWASLSGPKAAQAWQELVGWIDAVLLPRNPSLYTLASGAPERSWAPCWYLHPDALDELSALYGVWKLAFTGSTKGAARVAEWRDRWLPGAAARLAKILTPCTKSSGHRGTELRPDQTHDVNALYAHIQADLQHRAPE